MAPSEVDIPENLYVELSELFKNNDEAIERWLNTPIAFLEGKAPIKILETECGLESILDLIYRIKTGDLS